MWRLQSLIKKDQEDIEIQKNDLSYGNADLKKIEESFEIKIVSLFDKVSAQRRKYFSFEEKGFFGWKKIIRIFQMETIEERVYRITRRRKKR